MWSIDQLTEIDFIRKCFIIMYYLKTIGGYNDEDAKIIIFINFEFFFFTTNDIMLK